MKHRRWLGVLSMLGGLAAVPLIIALTLAGWGAPGTVAYQTYELLNRLMTFSLALMMAGWTGLFLLMRRGYGRWAVLLALVGASSWSSATVPSSGSFLICPTTAATCATPPSQCSCWDCSSQ